jgi:phage gp29-like protein
MVGKEREQMGVRGAGVVGLTQRIVNRIRGAGGRPRSGQIVLPRVEDTYRDYPSAGLTPSRLAAILREADAGSLSACMQLFEEMEEKDPHLYAVANTRRLALTGLQWQVLSAAPYAECVDRVQADEAAAFCRAVLTELERLDEVLQHLSLAMGRNIAVAELVWDTVGDEFRIVDIAPVDFTRIMFDDLDRPRLVTSDGADEGMALPPNKFVVHTPHAVSGHPARGGLLRATAMAYLAKNLALKDWMIFAEIFGMPVRVARYEPSASAEEKRELLHMLESLGSNAAGIFSRAIDLQVIEANRGTQGPPYERLVDYLNREMSKAWLGQTLTTDVAGVSGVLSATLVHDEVRKDLRADDIRKEGRTIRRDVLAPLARFKFGPDVPVPYFARKPGRSEGIEELSKVLDAAVNRLGVRVPAGWVHEALGIPRPAGGEEVLQAGRADRRDGESKRSADKSYGRADIELD